MVEARAGAEGLFPGEGTWRGPGEGAMALPTVEDGRTPEEGPEDWKCRGHPNRTSAGACLPPEATCPKLRRTLVVVTLAALEVGGGNQGPTLPAFPPGDLRLS